MHDILELTTTECSPGYFAELLKKEYQDRIQITAIDPSESAINQAKAKTDGGVDYRVATVADISTEEQLFDAILFTKSLHHVASLEEVSNKKITTMKLLLDESFNYIYSLRQTLGKARELMKTDGVLVIEDVDFEALNERTVGWFMDRIDLLHIAKVSHRHPEHEIASLLVQDMSVDSFKRWNTFFERVMKHHPMNHGHDHAMFGFKEMLDGTKRVFGQKNVHINARTVNLFQFASYVL